MKKRGFAVREVEPDYWFVLVRFVSLLFRGLRTLCPSTLSALLAIVCLAYFAASLCTFPVALHCDLHSLAVLLPRVQ